MRLQDIPAAPEILSLSDLLPKKVVVEFSDGRKTEVGPLTAGDLAMLMLRFPALQKYFRKLPLTFPELAAVAPGAVAVIIAAGCGFRDDIERVKQAEEIAWQLSVEHQAELLEGIGKATFTRGFGPFELRVAALGVQLRAEVGKELPTRSPKPLVNTGSPTEPASEKPGEKVQESLPLGSFSPSEIASAA